jgi:peptidoglycan hydrolase-like protein with peptidoglycan-binding domain
VFRLALLLVLLLTGAASAERRMAFVVGNDAYTEVPRLQKAVNDAEAVAATLATQGFEVTLVRDADRREMNRSLSDFTGRLGPGDTAFVFFAGHGVEIAGENYLLPVDIVAPAGGDRDFVASESIALSRLLDRVRATGARATIAVIDACRDNPFETTTGRSIGGTRGLGRIAAPEGTFVIFSAGARQMALDRLSDDDPDPNSVFTRALLPRLSRPGLELRDLVSDTRLEVRDLAQSRNHAQFPAYYDELLGPFYLIPAPPGAGPARSEPDPVAEDFALAREVGTPQALETFLDLHGSREGDFRVALARRMLEEAEGGPPLADTAGDRAPAADPLDRRAAIRAAQGALNALGCDAGTPDGIAGPRTAAAFENLRAANPGIPPDIEAFGRSAAGETVATAFAACPAERTAAAPRAAAFAGTWNYSARCLLLPVNGTIVARSAGGGRYATVLTDSLGNAGRGTATLSGRQISGQTDWGILQETWSATLAADGRSYTGRGSNGCTFTARRVN